MNPRRDETVSVQNLWFQRRRKTSFQSIFFSAIVRCNNNVAFKQILVPNMQLRLTELQKR